MINILGKAEPADFEFIIKTLGSWVNVISDRELPKLQEEFKVNPTPSNRQELSERIERELRYYGSSDIAYAIRWTYQDDPGVDLDTIISDVSRKLRIKHKPVGSIESRLERLVMKTVEKQILKMKPEDQRIFFESHNLSPHIIDELVGHLKGKGKVVIVPLIIQLAGTEVTTKIIQQLTVSLIARFIGTEAAKRIFTETAAKFPWWSEWIGPVMWGITVGWMAYDLQSPAYRKTVPIILYLGLIALRDGPTPENYNYMHGSPEEDDD